MTKRLVLFDIDGTLLSTKGDAPRAMMAAYKYCFGKSPRHDGLLMDGKTELQIVYDLMTSEGVDEQEIEARLPSLWDRYVDELKKLLTPQRVTVYPGVRKLIAALRERDDLVLGLLTGNIEASARIKLSVAGLDGFVLGAYGQYHRERNRLPAEAVAVAREKTGRSFAGKNIVILGDTPNDVLCGRELGVTAIAVATGRFSRADLAAESPDALFDDFSDTTAVVQAIDGHGSEPQSAHPGTGQSA